MATASEEPILVSARRLIDPIDQAIIKTIAHDIVKALNPQHLEPINRVLGSSAINSNFARYIADEHTLGQSRSERAVNFNQAVGDFIDSSETARAPLFAQLGGAVIHKSWRGNHRVWLVSVEIIGDAAKELMDENEEVTGAVTINSQKPPRRRRATQPHVTLMAASSRPQAEVARTMLNESEIPAMWVGLGTLLQG